MSETTLYAILFSSTFPALWLLAWWLDRVLPNPSERTTNTRTSKAQVKKLADPTTTIKGARLGAVNQEKAPRDAGPSIAANAFCESQPLRIITIMDSRI